MGNERGLTLIEMMASILIFGIMTLGVAPLLASSLQGSANSRAYTAGKSVVLEAMERIRGLPYFISFGSQNQKVDVLDLYYPCSSTTGGSCPTGSAYIEEAGPAFKGVETTCTTTTTGNPACLSSLLDTYTLTYRAEFVTPGGTQDGDELYGTVAPLAGYAWNDINKDLPATRLLRMSITATWSMFGRDREFEMTSLIAERKTGTEKVRGTGRVDHAAQALTTFVIDANNNNIIDPGERAELKVIGGTAESAIETQLLSQATQNAQGGTARLVREATDSTPATDLDSVFGATSALIAPPTASTTGTTASGDVVDHPDIPPGVDLKGNDIASLGGSNTTELSVTTASELPAAAGKTAVIERIWMTNKIPAGGLQNLLTGEGVEPLRFLVPSSGGTALSSETSATTTPVTPESSREVRTTATTSVADMSLFPVEFIPGSQGSRGVVLLQGFSATAACKATPTGTASATAGYGGTLKVWVEKSWRAAVAGGGNVFAGDEPNTSSSDGEYVTFDLGPSPATGRSAMAAWRHDPTDFTTNPMVWEDPLHVGSNGGPKDIYLFTTPGATHLKHTHTNPVTGATVNHEHPAYLSSWAPELNPGGAISDGGRFASASLKGAVEFNTAPIDPARPETSLQISVGSLSCEAVDRR